MTRILVTGAAGFIGNHLCRALVADGHHVVGVDLRRPEFAEPAATEHVLHDLTQAGPALDALFEGVERVYALAADVGSMGYIAHHDADIVLANTRINVNTLDAARRAGVSRYLFASSACVYPEDRQLSADVVPLSESMAYPAAPDTGYG